MVNRRKQRAVTLLELTLGMSIMGILMILLASVLSNSQTLWLQVTGGSDSAGELRKVSQNIQREIEMSGIGQINTTPVPAHLAAGGYDGDAVWFLSAINPSTGKVVRQTNGSPFWQRNILYYLIVPSGHAQTFGYSCTGGADADAYDDRCPHKILIRKEITRVPAPVANDDSTVQTLMTAGEIATYLTKQPNGYSLAPMAGESNANSSLSSVHILGKGLLTFRATLSPPPVQIEFRATNVLRANKTLHVGVDPLFDSGLTSQLKMTIVPENP